MNFKKKKDYFKETLKDHFAFSTNERRGLFAVILILLLLIVIKIAIVHWKSDSHESAFKEQIVLKDLNASKIKDTTNYNHRTLIHASVFNVKKQPELFSFNPNDLPEEDWRRLGFTDKQIQVIKHYESKGGKFFNKEDVKKIYSISLADYNRIEPYITIPVHVKAAYKKTEYVKYTSKPSNADFKVDIATADTTELEKLRGIGTAYANRIVKYRTKLGGFYSINQLHEVWGMSDSLYNVIADHIYISDSNAINRMNINTASFNDLKGHPYFTYKLANTLINYRIQHGTFKVLADIQKVPLVDEAFYRKIAPYLKVE